MVNHASLHCHSEHSILDGFSKVPEYLERAVALGLQGVGLTDHGTVSGIYQFIKKAKALELTPVPGCEMYVAPINSEGAHAQRPIFYGPNGQRAANFDVSGAGAFLHLTVLAINNEGLKNLFELSSMSYDETRYYSKPRIDFEMLEQHSDGLVVLTGCPSSEISTRFMLGQDEKAYEYAGRLKEVFGTERLFVEVMDHDMSIDLERVLLPKQLKLAKDLGLKLIATNDCHYAYRENVLHHEEMLCSQSGSRMADKTYDEGGSRFAFDGTEFYLKSGAEMLKIFPREHFPGAVENSLLIIEMAKGLQVDFDPHLKPHPDVPSGFTDETYFKKIINEGFLARYGNESPEMREEAKQRIAHEFEVIHSSDFIGYFLTVYEYMKWTKESYSVRDDTDSILALPTGVGRGSVGGSIIAYLLFISELCPIKHDLIFERFLSAGRGSTYRITYDDGSTEEVIVSDTKEVKTDNQTEAHYIHQLEIGDEVLS